MARRYSCGACGKVGHTIKRCDDEPRRAAYLLADVWGVLRPNLALGMSLGESLESIRAHVDHARALARDGSVLLALEETERALALWPADADADAATWRNGWRGKLVDVATRLRRHIEAAA